MMNEQDYYLTKIGEECAEITQRIFKLFQFGPAEVEPGQLRSNLQRVHSEILDLEATLTLARERLTIPPRPDRFVEIVDKRRERMNKYKQLSVDLGRIEK